MSARPADRFTWERALRDASGVPMHVRAAAMTLATYATSDTGGDIRPSLSRLAHRMGVDRSGLSRSVAAAVDLEWLAVVDGEPSDGTPRTYQLTTPTRGEE